MQMIDIHRETLLEVEAAAKRVGKKPRTIRRWMEQLDYKRRPKRRVLESVLIGGTRMTSEEALQRFSVQGPREPIAPTSLLSSAQQFDVAKQVLSQLGFKV